MLLNAHVHIMYEYFSVIGFHVCRLVSLLALFFSLSVQELAPLPIRAMSMHLKVFTLFRFKIGGQISFQHHLGFPMGERAFVSEVAGAVQLVVPTHFGSEFVHVGSGGGELFVVSAHRLCDRLQKLCQSINSLLMGINRTWLAN